MPGLERSQSSHGTARKQPSATLSGGNPATRRSKTNLAGFGYQNRQKSYESVHHAKGGPKRTNLSGQNLKQLSAVSPEERTQVHPFALTQAHPTRHHAQHKKASLSDKKSLKHALDHSLRASDEEDPEPGSGPDSSWVSESDASTPAQSRTPSPEPSPSPRKPRRESSANDLGATPRPLSSMPSSPQRQKPQSPSVEPRQASSSTSDTHSLTRRRNVSTASLKSNSSALSSRLMPALRQTPKALDPKLDRGFEAPSSSTSLSSPVTTATVSTTKSDLAGSRTRNTGTATFVSHANGQTANKDQQTSSDLTRRLEEAMASTGHQASQQQQQNGSFGKKASPSTGTVLGAWDMPHKAENPSTQLQRKRQSPLISKFVSPSSQTYPTPPPIKHRLSGSCGMQTLQEERDQSQHQSNSRPVSRTQQRLMMERNAPPVMPTHSTEPHYHPGSEVPCNQVHGQLIPPHPHHSPLTPVSPGSEERLHHQQAHQPDHGATEEDQPLNEPAHRARQVHSLKMWALAVVREAEKVDREHDFVRRYNDPVKDSLARYVIFSLLLVMKQDS